MINIEALRQFQIPDIIDDIAPIRDIEDDISEEFTLKNHYEISYYDESKTCGVIDTEDAYYQVLSSPDNRLFQELEYKKNEGKTVIGRYLLKTTTADGKEVYAKYKGHLTVDEKLAHGYGKMIHMTMGVKCEGDFQNDEMMGYGIIQSGAMKYEGQVHSGIFHGSGRMIMQGRYKACGLFNSGVHHGNTKVIFEDGSKYIGIFAYEAANGKGRFIYPNNDRYEGDLVNNTPHGYGIMIYANGNRYEGNFHEGMHHGYGVLINPAGQVFEGNFVNGILEEKPSVLSKFKKMFGK